MGIKPEEKVEYHRQNVNGESRKEEVRERVCVGKRTVDTMGRWIRLERIHTVNDHLFSRRRNHGFRSENWGDWRRMAMYW